jgi:hypothetical protein
VPERRFSPEHPKRLEDNMSDQNDDLRAERARLQAEIARLQVARDTGVPVGILSDATTVEDAQALADVALAWRGNQAPAAPPPTAAAPAYLPNQISRETLPYMTAQEISAAHRRGQLEGIGAAPPAARKTGERNGHNR